MVRSRWKWVALGVVLLLIAAEVGLNVLKPSEVLVKIVNGGQEPLLNVEITVGAESSFVDRIDPQQAHVFLLSSYGKTPLALKFNQLNNPLSDFVVPEFDARKLSQEGSVLVLEVRPNEVARYVEPDERPGALGRLYGKARGLVEAPKASNGP